MRAGLTLEKDIAENQIHLCEYAFKFLLSALPVGQDTFQQPEKCRSMVRFGNMTKFMRDNVVDRID
jgi:hypothetical protein